MLRLKSIANWVEMCLRHRQILNRVLEPLSKILKKSPGVSVGSAAHCKIFLSVCKIGFEIPEPTIINPSKNSLQH
jgi:hypothetical protein